ncbi:DUF6602 domain-containing protein [Streptomyces sp. DG2A-72]|uniref:DUF6602 domain-containing protein n=1 Tax=Streptomyces sp. DG2A-72 TaxID=3051386 RepID=UPI0034648052
MSKNVHHRWLQSVEEDIQREYARLHEAARSDPQRAGHGGEGTWRRILGDWLPPQYEVATRKYIIPEVPDGDVFETDLVVFQPSYPQALRQREEVLASGVAAAFSVKLTLNRDGIRDAFERAAKVQRGIKPWLGTPRHEMTPPFPVGLLAHSHSWKKSGTSAAWNVYTLSMEMDKRYAKHPRESLDFLCVSDLGMWCTSRVPFIPQDVLLRMNAEEATRHENGAALTSVMQMDAGESPTVAVLIANLYARLALNDPTLRPLADGFRATGDAGGGGGMMRFWELSTTFSPAVCLGLRMGVGRDRHGDWNAIYG